MSVNSKPPAQTIEQWLYQAAETLAKADIPSARLDAELILAHALKQERTWVIAHRDETADFTQARTLLDQRIKHVPLAYLTGHREFYGREFTVNDHVLIPRPETEVIIDQVRNLVNQRKATVLDVGCGSGCIAITLKLEMPQLTVTALDIDRQAIKTTQINAQHLHADIKTQQSNLLEKVDDTYDFIVANLPYVDIEWVRSPETDYEPSLALFASAQGLALIKQLISDVPGRLSAGGYLLLEADPEQHEPIAQLGRSSGLRHIDTTDYIVTLQKS